MLKNYLKTAYRSLIRNKVYSILNILGLALGITCFTIIFLHVEDELSFDSFHENESFRFLMNERVSDGETRTYGVVGATTLDDIADNVAGIEDVLLARDYGAGPLLVEYNDVKFKTRRMFFAEPDFFDYFDFKLLQGNPETALAEPNNVVLTKSTAEKIFGNTDPVGKLIRYSGGMNFTLQVTGVVEDVKNSHIDFDFLMNFDLKDDSGFIIMREGFANSVYGYFKFEPGVEAEDVATRLKAHYLEVYKDNAETLALLDREEYNFQSVHDIYFGSKQVVYDDGLKKGDQQNLLILSGIGLFILLIACMNYINSATAKAISRSKEIGVRKVFGAFKAQLRLQFMGEALMVSTIAVLLSILLTDISIPMFESLIGKPMRFSLMENTVYFPMLFLILISVTLLSGLYPAIVLSSFKPSDSLKIQSGKKLLSGSGLRSLLVGIQLVFTLILISSILLIVKQTNFINDMDLGFSKEDILIVPNNSNKIGSQLTTYKNELLRSPYIHQATTSMDVLGFGSTTNSGRVIVEGQIAEEAPVAAFFGVGMDFIDVQGIKMKEGRNFNSALVSDSTAIIVNEAFARANGIDNLLDKKAKLWTADGEWRAIIGIAEDFNFQSLHSAVSPAIFMVAKNRNWFWTLKIDPEHKKEALEHAKMAWESIESEYPFGHMFLEDRLNNFYGEEARLQSAIQAFGLICIFISCMGLYGMTAFTIEQRLKEIGIRKVLGAQIRQLVWMINQKFVGLLMVASVIAIPLVYYLIGQWLGGFAYHINIGLSSFLLGGAIVLLIVLVTVSWQAIKAGLTDPIKTLRQE